MKKAIVLGLVALLVIAPVVSAYGCAQTPGELPEQENSGEVTEEPGVVVDVPVQVPEVPPGGTRIPPEEPGIGPDPGPPNEVPPGGTRIPPQPPDNSDSTP